MSSFGAITWDEHGVDGASYASHSAQYVGAMQRYPGGGNVLAQTLPDQTLLVTTTAITTLAIFTSLLALIGTSGALTLAAESGTALLVDVGNAREMAGKGTYFYDMTFLITNVTGSTGGTGSPPPPSLAIIYTNGHVPVTTTGGTILNT